MASGKAPSIALSPIENPDVGGVRFRKHPLEVEAGRLNHIAHRLGNRLLLWLRETEEPGAPGKVRKPRMIKLERVVGRDMETGKSLREVVLDDQGREMLVPILPDEDFRESFKLYERAVRNLLVEQRARAAMGAGKGGAPLDDATFKAGLDELVRETIKSMPIGELRELLKGRAIDVDGLSVPDADTSGGRSSVDVSLTDAQIRVGVDGPTSSGHNSGDSVDRHAPADAGPSVSASAGDFLPGLMGDNDDE